MQTLTRFENRQDQLEKCHCESETKLHELECIVKEMKDDLEAVKSSNAQAMELGFISHVLIQCHICTWLAMYIVHL